MKIAIVAVVTKPIVSHPLGGTEQFTYLLVQGLAQRGYNVTLYCAKGSQTDATKQVEICKPEEAMGEESNIEFVYPYTLLTIKRLLHDSKKEGFDIVHASFLKTFLLSYFAKEIKIPILYTIHRDFFSNKRVFTVYEKIGFLPHEHFVFVAKHAYEKSLYKKNTHYIYNGLNINDFPFSSKAGDAFLWFSRIDPLKGAREAVIAAKNAGVMLSLVGDIDRPKHREYFDQEVQPMLTNNITYQPSPEHEKKIALYQHAKALVFPTMWEEPFPYIILESLASGTPVIAFARGSLPETVQDGKTGFLVNPSNTDIRGKWVTTKTGIEGISEAMKKIDSLSSKQYKTMRGNCRERIEKVFTADKMVASYLDLYKKLR